MRSSASGSAGPSTPRPSTRLKSGTSTSAATSALAPPTASCRSPTRRASSGAAASAIPRRLASSTSSSRAARGVTLVAIELHPPEVAHDHLHRLAQLLGRAELDDLGARGEDGLFFFKQKAAYEVI